MKLVWDDLAFLRPEEVEAFHQHGLEVAGGSAGVRDRGLLVAAVESIRNAYHLNSIASVAGAYAFRIAKAHAFVDGNKRAALMAGWQFVHMNVFSPSPPREPAGLELAIEAAAGGRMSEGDLARAFAAAMGGDVEVVQDDAGVS